MYEMYKDYEDRIENLNLTVKELESEIKKFTIIINEKDYQIKQLMDDNSRLQAQIQQKFTYQGTVASDNLGIEPVGAPAYDVRVSITPDQISNPGLTPVLKVKSNPVLSAQKIPKPHVKPLQSGMPQDSPQYKPYPSKGTLKRVCPHCGAMGFAIKEVDDRNKILSYVPYRIYAKKKVCSKCFNEW